MTEIECYPHLLDSDLVQEQKRLRRGVHETVPPCFTGLVLDEERNLAQVTGRLTDGLDKVLPCPAIVVLEVEFVAVRQGAAGDLVGPDGLRVLFRSLDEIHSLGADPWFGRTETAVAELRLRLHVDVYRRDAQP